MHRVFQNFLSFCLLCCSTFATSHLLPAKRLNTDADHTNLTTLRNAQVIFRHGDRAPLVEYSQDPYNNEIYWPHGLKTLTAQGKRMEYELGQYIRLRYDGFIGKTYKPREVYVESSDTERTMMSALCVAAGFYPVNKNDAEWYLPVNWQPVSVHTVPQHIDNYIHFKAPCKGYWELNRHYLTASDLARKVNEENRDLYAYLRKHTGLNVTEFEQVSDLFDTLRIQRMNNLTLPQWADSVYEKMAALEALPYDSRVILPTDDAKRLRGGPLLGRVIRKMNSVLSQGDESITSAKLHIVSGHDGTIATLLGTLGMFDGTHVPGFGSSVYIELHEDFLVRPGPMERRNVDSSYVVKIYYKNPMESPAVELHVPVCRYPCRLDKFKSLFGHLQLDGEEWVAACDLTSNSVKVI